MGTERKSLQLNKISKLFQFHLFYFLTLQDKKDSPVRPFRRVQCKIKTEVYVRILSGRHGVSLGNSQPVTMVRRFRLSLQIPEIHIPVPFVRVIIIRGILEKVKQECVVSKEGKVSVQTVFKIIKQKMPYKLLVSKKKYEKVDLDLLDTIHNSIGLKNE